MIFRVCIASCLQSPEDRNRGSLESFQQIPCVAHLELFSMQQLCFQLLLSATNQFFELAKQTKDKRLVSMLLVMEALTLMD